MATGTHQNDISLMIDYPKGETSARGCSRYGKIKEKGEYCKFGKGGGINMEDEETEAKARFYNSLADLLNVIREKIEDHEPWIYICVEKEE